MCLFVGILEAVCVVAYVFTDAVCANLWELCVQVLEAVCVILDVKPAKIKDDSGKMVADYWKPSVGLLNEKVGLLLTTISATTCSWVYSLWGGGGVGLPNDNKVYLLLKRKSATTCNMVALFLGEGRGGLAC